MEREKERERISKVITIFFFGIMLYIHLKVAKGVILNFLPIKIIIIIIKVIMR